MDTNPAHEHNSNEYFDNLLQQAIDSNTNSESSASPESLKSDAQLGDNYQPEDQKERSRAISAILRHYEHSYKNKVDFQCRYRKILFWGCSLIIIAFVGATLCVLNYAIHNIDSIDISGVATVITATLSLVISIMSLVQTITKYCFPKNDEEYIVRIVESIQGNDLERTKELNRAAEVRGEQQRRDGNSGN